jgi:hypothetical protein
MVSLVLTVLVTAFCMLPTGADRQDCFDIDAATKAADAGVGQSSSGKKAKVPAPASKVKQHHYSRSLQPGQLADEMPMYSRIFVGGAPCDPQDLMHTVAFTLQRR